MTSNYDLELPNLFTTFDEIDGSFDCPSKWKSLTFTPAITAALLFLHRLASGWIMVSGSAAVAETMLRSDVEWHTVFKPGDIDVYVHTDHLQTNKYYDPKDPESVGDNIKRLIAQFISGMWKRHDVEVIDVTKVLLYKNEGDKLHYNYGFSRTLRMNAMFEFQVRDSTEPTVYGDDAISPIKIQLMFVAPTPAHRRSGPAVVELWQRQILRHYDLNICRAVYDVKRRVVSFPTDPFIADYVNSKQFIYEFQRNNRNSMERIAKYIERGFKLVGFHDRDSAITLSVARASVTRDQSDPTLTLLRPTVTRKRRRHTT
jgi:hypothetical protein